MSTCGALTSGNGRKQGAVTREALPRVGVSEPQEGPEPVRQPDGLWVIPAGVVTSTGAPTTPCRWQAAN